MIKLDLGNVLLKPSHRRQLMGWLRRAVRLGERLGDFVLKLSLHRSGNRYEVRADVTDARGSFNCRTRKSDWRDALREVVAALTARLHAQRVTAL
jgi:hypothetical protein